MGYQTIDGITADADFSAKQFTAVKMGTATDFMSSLFAAATDLFLGVLQNKPEASGEPAEVVYAGTCKVKLGGAVTRGDMIEPAADGEFISTTEITDGGAATINVVGVALQNGANQEVIYAVIGNQGNHS